MKIWDIDELCCKYLPRNETQTDCDGVTRELDLQQIRQGEASDPNTNKDHVPGSGVSRASFLSRIEFRLARIEYRSAGCNHTNHAHESE